MDSDVELEIYIERNYINTLGGITYNIFLSKPSFLRRFCGGDIVKTKIDRRELDVFEKNYHTRTEIAETLWLKGYNEHNNKSFDDCIDKLKRAFGDK